MTESGKSQGGGNTKYIVGGLLLLIGAAVVVFMLRPPQAAAPAPEAPKPPAEITSAERVNPMAQPELILDEPKDAGKPAEEVAAKEQPRAQQPKEARDEWDCSGDLSRESLQAVIDKNRAQVRNCYERRLKVNNVLQGDLKLKLKIANNGQVNAVAVNGSLHDNEVFSCVRQVAQKWSFTPPTDGNCAVVQVPFQFAPKTN